jgi:Xaa-Pro aminopeptidase
METLLAEVSADHLIYCGANRFSSAVQWLTQWPVTAEAVGVLSPGLRDALFVQYCNHVPQAKRLAEADVRWGGESSIVAACDELANRGARSGRVAAIGPLTADQYTWLSARFGRIVNSNRAYLRQRTIKSAEEVDWMRIGAHMSDRAMMALRDGLRPGLTERQLADLIERAYVADGGLLLSGLSRRSSAARAARRGPSPRSASKPG